MLRDQALEAARSDEWSCRAEAGPALATESDDECAAALGRLLLDRRDEAVAQATAIALLGRNDRFAAWLVFSAIALATVEQNDHLLMYVAAAIGEGTFDLNERRHEIEASESPWAREGLRFFLSWHAR